MPISYFLVIISFSFLVARFSVSFLLRLTCRLLWLRLVIYGSERFRGLSSSVGGGVPGCRNGGGGMGVYMCSVSFSACCCDGLFLRAAVSQSRMALCRCRAMATVVFKANEWVAQHARLKSSKMYVLRHDAPWCGSVC